MIEQALNAISSTETWYLNLPLVSKYIFAASLVALLLSITTLVKAVYRVVFIARRWLRRKLISKNVDLKLDREITYVPTTTKKKRFWPRKRQEIYGEDLSDNISKMRKEAPFKPHKSEEDS